MSCVFFRGPEDDKRWYARFKDETGRWVSRRIRQDNKREAEAVAREMEAKAERLRLGVDPRIPSTETVGGLAQRWVNSLVNQDWKNDRDQFEKWIVSRFGGVPARGITTQSVSAWIAEMMAANVSPESIRHHVGRLSRFFQWALANGRCDFNPCRQLPRGSLPMTKSVRLKTGSYHLIKFLKAQQQKGLVAIWVNSKDSSRIGQILSQNGLLPPSPGSPETRRAPKSSSSRGQSSTPS